MEPAEKGGNSSPSPPPAKVEIKIPSLSPGKAASEAPKPPKAAETPPTGQKPAESPTGGQDEGVLDVSSIPTDIRGNKSASQYAEERRKSKLDKAAETLGVPQLQQEFDSTKTAYAEAQLRIQKYDVDLADRDRQLEEMKRIADQRKAEIDTRENDYFERYQVRFDPGDDEELRTASQSLRDVLVESMPTRVPGVNGDVRVLFKDVMANPQRAGFVDNILANFQKHQDMGDSAGMDMDVNAMAQLMGANVKFSPRPEESELLDSSNPAFVEIERAMIRASPAFGKKQSRQQFISDQAPALAQQQIRQRETGIATNLRKGIFLDQDTRNSIAAQNPHDGRVVLGMIMDVSPQLKDEAERFISSSAPALARMGEIRMPTLTSKDPAAIQLHRQEQQRYQRQLGEMTINATIGHLAGLVLPAMVGELEALRARVGDIAANENPGGTRHSDDGGGDRQIDVSQIPTKIVPGRR